MHIGHQDDRLVEEQLAEKRGGMRIGFDDAKDRLAQARAVSKLAARAEPAREVDYLEAHKRREQAGDYRELERGMAEIREAEGRRQRERKALEVPVREVREVAPQFQPEKARPDMAQEPRWKTLEARELPADVRNPGMAPEARPGRSLESRFECRWSPSQQRIEYWKGGELCLSERHGEIVNHQPELTRDVATLQAHLCKERGIERVNVTGPEKGREAMAVALAKEGVAITNREPELQAAWRFAHESYREREAFQRMTPAQKRAYDSPIELEKRISGLERNAWAWEKDERQKARELESAMSIANARYELMKARGFVGFDGRPVHPFVAHRDPALLAKVREREARDRERLERRLESAGLPKPSAVQAPMKAKDRERQGLVGESWASGVSRMTAKPPRRSLDEILVDLERKHLSAVAREPGKVDRGAERNGEWAKTKKPDGRERERDGRGMEP